MRGLLIFLLIAIGTTLATPAFWWLLSAEFGAAPSLTIHQDGTSTPTLIGPGAPWPDWAQVPGVTKLIVSSASGPSTTQPAGGAGTVEFGVDGDLARRQVAQGLERLGWKVGFFKTVTPSPDRPSQTLTWCILHAVRDAALPRSLVIQFHLEPPSRQARVFWYEGLVKQPLLSTEGGCQ
ncbi:MAG TPA: hypothetical protein VJ890_18200 [Vineibacter sp.]|nr:hypothetical protein [Vineibacter sp.]